MNLYRVTFASGKGELDYAATRSLVNEHGGLELYEDKVHDGWISTSELVAAFAHGEWVSIEKHGPSGQGGAK